jgi:hypothetical protein
LSLILREEHRVSALENRVLRKILVSKRKKREMGETA